MIKKQHRKLVKMRKAENIAETDERWEAYLATGSLDRQVVSLPTEVSVPAWASKVAANHRLYYRGGFFVCGRCGAFAGMKPQKLLLSCSGKGACLRAMRAILVRDRLPPGYKVWPDGNSLENRPLSRIEA